MKGKHTVERPPAFSTPVRVMFALVLSLVFVPSSMTVASSAQLGEETGSGIATKATDVPVEASDPIGDAEPEAGEEAPGEATQEDVQTASTKPEGAQETPEQIGGVLAKEELAGGSTQAQKAP